MFLMQTSIPNNMHRTITTMKQNAKNAAKLCRNIKRASSDWAKLLLHKGLRQRRDESNKLNVCLFNGKRKDTHTRNKNIKAVFVPQGSLLYI